MAYLGKHIFFMLLFLFPQVTFAGSNLVGLYGNQLYNLCKSDSQLDVTMCEGYIWGVQDTIYSGHLSEHFNLCFPEGVSVTQFRLQTINFMEKNPNLLHFAAEGLVGRALSEIYACRKKENN